MNLHLTSAMSDDSDVEIASLFASDGETKYERNSTDLKIRSVLIRMSLKSATRMRQKCAKSALILITRNVLTLASANH